MNIIAEMNAEYVGMIQTARKMYEKTGNMTVFRRKQDHETQVMTIKHGVTVHEYEKAALDDPEAAAMPGMIRTRSCSEAEAVRAFHSGGWECIAT